ncbi:MAG: hypothetical protein JEZ12_13070 [Desulfobacterium sp.]|nr:hypothetical protein [Desulfobacterium sp.]
MKQIPFSPDVDVELLEVEHQQVDFIEVDAGFGSSLYQAFQDYLTLDGGRPADNFTNIKPLDGGRP